MVEDQEIAIIIGAGPAGLTAAYELLNKTNIKPIILEKTGEIGGISKTVNYKGNRMDIGGHRFFSKSDRIMKFWKNILPLQCAPAHDDLILKREVQLSELCQSQGQKSGNIAEYDVPDPEKTDNVMLNRTRVSRIYFLRKFFDYPVSLTQDTLKNLGFKRTFKIGMSYLSTVLMHSKPEKSLEDFFINRFGRELYLTFFKDYTEKVWGVQCSEIKADWGSQRIKGLSIQKTLENAVKSKFSNASNLSQKDVETSLIGQFLYPKLGPGQMWEELAARILEKGVKSTIIKKLKRF
ncbi:MAG: NAD(P)-binding protein [Methanobacterium sp. ERen5]|nr:MAG: NAD(P)-binding protein [Methanobacterium sp. ERen5]